MLAVFLHSLLEIYLSTSVRRWIWMNPVDGEWAKEQVDSQDRIIVYEINAPKNGSSVELQAVCFWLSRKEHVFL